MAARIPLELAAGDRPAYARTVAGQILDALLEVDGDAVIRINGQVVRLRLAPTEVRQIEATR